MSPDRRASRGRPFLRSVRFGIAFGAAIGFASVPGALWIRGTIDSDLGLALLLFGAGAIAAGFLTSLLVNQWGAGLSKASRLALAVLSLVVLTAGFDALFLYFNYISYYVQWWPDPFTSHWFFTAISTFLGVSYYYVTIAVPMLIPVGLPVVFGFGLIAARR